VTTDTMTGRQRDASDFIICPMLRYSNGTDKNKIGELRRWQFTAERKCRHEISKAKINAIAVWNCTVVFCVVYIHPWRARMCAEDMVWGVGVVDQRRQFSWAICSPPQTRNSRGMWRPDVSVSMVIYSTLFVIQWQQKEKTTTNKQTTIQIRSV